MRDYLLSGEWVRFAFVFGIAVSMVMYEKRHLTTGSIVVPGYIAVFLIHPLVIIATFINALVTYAFVNKFLSRHFLLYGRTKFTVLAVTSTAIQTVMLRLSPSGTWLWEMDIPFFTGVGYIVPALIAHDMGRQGIKKTGRAVMIAGFIVLIPIAIALILDLPGVNDLSPVSGFGQTSISLGWLPFAIVLSVLASWAVAQNHGWRSGGFIGAAFVGMFMADPLQVVAAAVIAAATYLIVAKFLMKHMILFGRRKFSSMLLVSSSIAWSGLWLGDRFLPIEWEQRLGVGSLALTPLMLPGLLANDAQRTSPKSVVRGVVLAGTFAVTTTWWVESIYEGLELHPAWKFMSAISAVILYKPQVVSMVEHMRERSMVKKARLVAASTEPAMELTLVKSAPVELAVAEVPPLARVVYDAAPTDADPIELETPELETPELETTELETNEPERVAAMQPVPSGGDDWDEWAEWAEAYPAAATDAARWLDEQLAEITGAAQWLDEQLAEITRASPDLAIDDPALTKVSSDLFDFDSGSVLHHALVADRGMRPVPRRPDVDTSGDDAGFKISETSDDAREAQLVSSDVSDNTYRALVTNMARLLADR